MTMLEKMARAIYNRRIGTAQVTQWEGLSPLAREEMCLEADAALDALMEPQTPAVLEAGRPYCTGDGDDDELGRERAAYALSAMLNAIKDQAA